MSTSGPNGAAGLWPALDRALTQGKMGSMVLQDAQDAKLKGQTQDWASRLLMGPTSVPSATPNYQAFPQTADGAPDVMGMKIPKPAPAAPLMSDETTNSLMNTAIGPKNRLEAMIGAQAARAADRAKIHELAPNGALASGADGIIARAPGAAPKVDLVTIKPRVGPSVSFDSASQQDQIRAAIAAGGTEVKTPAAAVSITNTGDKAVTGVDAKRYEATTQALQTLDQMQPFMDRMAEAAADGAQTGFGQDWMLKARQAVGALTGEVPKGTSEQEVFQAAQNYLGPRMRVTGSGSSSDRDVALFLDSIPSLTKTGAGNQALQDMYAKIRNRTAQVAGIQQDLLRQNNYIPVDQERKLVAALGPLFSEDDRKVIKAAKSAGPSAMAPAAPARPTNAPPTAKPAPDGNWYSPDPDRPGKYLKW